MESPPDAHTMPLGSEHFSTSPVCDEPAMDLAGLLGRAPVAPPRTMAFASHIPSLSKPLWITPKPRRRSLWRLALRCSVSTFKVVLPLAVLASLTFNYSEVRGASMMPGIHDRDRILVDRVTYTFTEVERGDVIVMRYPLDPSLDYIKRVVGLPGDDVVIQYGGVWINGEPLEQPYVELDALDPSTSLHTTVQKGSYFVLGDNRLRSSDSREFGQVNKSLVRGKVRLRVWPPERAGWVD
jgi:signal peptidase I